MKKFKSYLACLAVFALFLTSCSKDEPASNLDSDRVATVTFSSLLSDMNDALNKQSEDALPDCSSETPAFAEISLTYGAGDTEVNVVVPIMMDGQGYFTVYDEDLEIPVPMEEDWVSISLNTFNVWSDNGMGAPGTLIWKAPMDGSVYDQFVTDALPIPFNLRAGSKNYVDVEVLCFDDREVNKYGYQFFDIIPEELRELCFFVNYCTDEGRHFTANYDLDLYYFTGESTENTPLLTDLDLFYSNRSPVKGFDEGAYYTDPYCLAIPEPQLGEGPGEAYLYYEVTLTPWDDNYTFPTEAVVSTGFLSWNDIKGLLDTDEDGDIGNNTDANYWHVGLNCDFDNGGNGPVEGDEDGDGVPDTIDECENTPDGATVNSVGCPSDSDGDSILDGIDQCPGTPDGATVNEVGCVVEDCATPNVCHIPQTNDDLEADCYFVYPDFSDPDAFVALSEAENTITLENTFEDTFGTLTLTGNLAGGYTLHLDGTQPTDRVIAYEIEVVDNLGDDCSQSFCDDDVEIVLEGENQSPVVVNLNNSVIFDSTIYVRVKAIICETPVGTPD